jgi:hypothetical protein
VHAGSFVADLGEVAPGLQGQRRLYLGNLVAGMGAVEHRLLIQSLAAQVIIRPAEATKRTLQRYFIATLVMGEARTQISVGVEKVRMQI